MPEINQHNYIEHRFNKIEESLSSIDKKLDDMLADRGDYRERLSGRLARIEERQESLRRIVYGAIGIFTTVSGGIVLHLVTTYINGVGG